MIYCWLIVSVRAVGWGRRQQEQCSQAAEAPRQPRAFAPGVAVVAAVAVAVSAKYQWYLWNILITLFEAVASTTCKSAHQLLSPPCQSLHYFHTDLAAKNTSGGRCESIWQKKTPQGSLLANMGKTISLLMKQGTNNNQNQKKSDFEEGSLGGLLNVNHNTSGSTWTFLEKKQSKVQMIASAELAPEPLLRETFGRLGKHSDGNHSQLRTQLFWPQYVFTLHHSLLWAFIQLGAIVQEQAFLRTPSYGFFLCLNWQTQTSLWTCNISWYIECLWYNVVLQ